MTKLFSDNFESYADASTATGWTTAKGGGMLVLTASIRGTGNVAASGTKMFGRNNVNDSAYNSAVGIIGDQGYRSAMYAAPNMSIGPMLRCDATCSNGYLAYYKLNGGVITLYIYKVVANGQTLLGSFATALAPTNGTDLIHFRAEATGTTTTTIRAKAWLNATAEPGWGLTQADSSTPFQTGYVAVFNSDVSGSFVGTDNIVITNAAGGEDFFYPAGATVNLTGSTTTQANTSSTGAVTVTPPAPNTVNLAGSSCSQSATSSAGAVGVVPPPGTLTTRIHGLNNGQVLANIPNCKLTIWDSSTGVLVLKLSGLTTNVDGRLSVTNAALSRTGSYSYDSDLTAAGYGRRLPVAVAT